MAARVAMVLLMLGLCLGASAQAADPVWPSVCHVVQPEDLDR